jgi:YfiH family protein
VIEAPYRSSTGHVLYSCDKSRKITAGLSLKPFYRHLQDYDRDTQIRKFIDILGFSGFNFVRCNQIHSAEVIEAQPGLVKDADGLITRDVDLFISVVVADCLPLFIWDISDSCIALLHAGWRGTRKRIAQQGIEALVNRCGCKPANLACLLGPSICPKCYEVGPAVAGDFSADVLLPGKGDRSHLDLRKANYNQLIEAGVSPDAIYSDSRCTFCHEDLFFSYRREGTATGRMIAVLGIARSEITAP